MYVALGCVFDYATIACALRWGVALVGDYVTPRPDEVHSICNCRGTYMHQVPL